MVEARLCYICTELNGSYLDYWKQGRCGFLVSNQRERLLGAGSSPTASEGDPLFYVLQAIRKGKEMVKRMGLVWFRVIVWVRYSAFVANIATVDTATNSIRSWIFTKAIIHASFGSNLFSEKET